MTKGAKLGVVALSSLVLLCSCSEKPNDGTSENYDVASVETKNTTVTDNKYVGYTFEYPKEWKVIRNDGMIAVQSGEDNPAERVTISCVYEEKNDPELTVNSYWYGDGTKENPGYYEEMKKIYGKDFTEREKKEIKLGNTGAPALRVTYNAKVADKEYKISQVVSVIYGNVYTFTYTALPDSFKSHEEDFTHAVSSFKLK